MTALLQAKGLKKSYDDRVLFSGIEFSVSEGERVALPVAEAVQVPAPDVCPTRAGRPPARSPGPVSPARPQAVVEPSVFVTDRSATGDPIDVDAVAALFPDAGSDVALVAVATFTMGSGAVYPDGTA